MNIEHLTADLFYNGVVNGCHELIESKDRMNAINVFPVADGDTGDNMASTAQAIIHLAQQSDDLSETAKSIADAAVIGAHGNSGMIFSQFFNGLAEGINHDLVVSPQVFSKLILHASASVRQSIAHPVEGTILTMMDKWAELLNKHAKQSTCFIQLFKDCEDSLDKTLQATQSMLDVLKEAKVVDAGALGFTQFARGFTNYICDPKAMYEHHEVAETIYQQAHLGVEYDHPPALRYCTEAVICQSEIDQESLGKLLTSHGDSVVISVNPRLCRFHVHCNKPWLLFDELRNHGLIKYPKVDDMHRQYEQVHHRKSPIALVMDSSANVPQVWMDDHQIHLIPVNVHLDGNDLLDYYCVDNDNFYQQLSQTKQYPQTSFPAPGVIKHKFQQIYEHYDHVIVITISQALSGTHDAIARAAADFDNITVVNSKSVAVGSGLMVLEAAKRIKACEPVEEIVKVIDTLSNRIQVLVMVDQFDSLIRSGRVSRIKGKLAQWSGAKPILSLDEEGKVMLIDKAFSERKAFAKMIQTVLENSSHNRLMSYAIIHAGAEEKARSFAELTEEAFSMKPEFIEPASLAIGLHAGHGTIGLAVQYEEPIR
ncbi:DegV family protein [Legionella sp. W05-934-2]|uniref:DegV family protein n=1 Tax=Legionella sp. W05-934-2 TaxID=1198649 RepID=UPI003461CDD6